MNESNKKVKLSNGQTAEELTARLPIPGPGRPKETPENKELKKARKQLIEEYKDALAEALPMISPVLIKKAFSGQGDIQAIKEINDILVDKAPRKIIGDPDNPFIIQISQEAAKKYDTPSNSK